MTKELNIYQKILKCIEEVGDLENDMRIKYNGQDYKALSIGTILDAVKPLFVKHGIVALCSYNDVNKDGNLTECIPSLTIINSDKPDDRFEIKNAGIGHGADYQDKGAGKSATNGFKVALCRLLLIAGKDEDVERGNVNHKSQQELYNELVQSLHDKINQTKTLEELNKVKAELTSFKNGKMGFAKINKENTIMALGTSYANQQDILMQESKNV